MKHIMLRFSFLFIFILILPYLYAGNESERLILAVDKANYSAVEQAVTDAGSPQLTGGALSAPPEARPW